MGMKSQMSFITGTPMKLILVMIAAIGFLAFVTLGSGNITEFLRQTCEKYPDLPFCGGLPEVETRDYQTAKKSTEALVCAINSVAQGSEWGGNAEIDCSKYYGKFEPGLVPGTDYEQIEKTINAGLGVEDDEACEGRCIEELCDGIPTCYVERSTYTQKSEESKMGDTSEPGKVTYTSKRCECIVKVPTKASAYCGEPDYKKVFDIVADDYDEAESRCEKFLGEASSTASSGKTTEEGKTIYECYYRGISCKVYNFQLPQEVSDAEKWITDYGDPAYIVRWGIFPPEEDTWTFRPDWRIHALIAVVSMIPPTKVAGAGMKLGWTAFKGPSRKLVLKTLRKELGEEVAEEALEKYGKKELTNLLARIAKQKGKRYFMKELLKQSLYDVVQKRLTAKGITSMAIRGAVLEGAVLFAAFADSMSEKYEPKGNALALKSPFEDAETFQLSDEMMGTPVIVDWEIGSAVNSQQSAHLVSPCKLDYFDVKMEDVICGDYTYNAVDGTIFCNEPKIGGGDDIIECGTFDSNIDKYIGRSNELYDMLKAELESKVKKFSEGDGEDLKIYLPLLSDDDNQQYLTNFKLTQSGATEHEELFGLACKGKDLMYKLWDPCYETTSVYTVDVYRGSESVGLAYVRNGDEVVMREGKEYVVHMYPVHDKHWNLVYDIYDTELCNDDPLLVEYNQMWPGEHEYKLQQLTCSEVKGFTSYIRTLNQLKALVEDVHENKRERKTKIIPDSDIKAEDILANVAIFGEELSYNCVSNPLTAQCVRTLRSPLQTNMKCVTGFTIDKEDNGNTCTLDMNLGPISENVEIIRDDDEYYSLSTLFSEPEAGLGGVFFEITFEDDDIDGIWDTLKVVEEDITTVIFPSPRNAISLSDIDENGEPQHVSMKNCHTRGVVLDFGDDLKDRLDEDVNPNYCLRHRTKWANILYWGEMAIAVTTVTVATVFAGPLGFYGVWATLAIGGALEFGTAVAEDWVMSWP